jgi:S1-C subfamily serine protease
MKTLKVWQITLLLLIGLSSGTGTNAYAQELRDLFRQVKASVVTVRTVEREIKPQSKGEFVKTPGIGSGVLISADGKVMTAAHIVQAADRVVVEFTEGKEIPADVLASVITAYRTAADDFTGPERIERLTRNLIRALRDECCAI